MLLEVDAMMDVTFTLKDVIYIVSIVLSIAGMFFNLRANNRAVNLRVKNVELRQVDDTKIIHSRIERTQASMSDFMTKIDGEIKDTNDKLNDINLSLGEIKGSLKNRK